MVYPVAGRGSILFPQRGTVVVARYRPVVFSFSLVSLFTIFLFNEAKIVELYICEYSCVRCLGYREDLPLLPPHSAWAHPPVGSVGYPTVFPGPCLAASQSEESAYRSAPPAGGGPGELPWG